MVALTAVAFLEAILNGKPAIISQHPVFNEYKDGVHVLKAKSPEEFVKKIDLLRKDQKLANMLVKNAHSHLEHHDLKISIKKIAQLYDTLLSD